MDSTVNHGNGNMTQHAGTFDPESKTADRLADKFRSRVAAGE